MIWGVFPLLLGWHPYTIHFYRCLNTHLHPFVNHFPSPTLLCYQGTRATRPMRAMRAILEERAWIVIWYLFRKKKTKQKFVDCDRLYLHDPPSNSHGGVGKGFCSCNLTPQTLHLYIVLTWLVEVNQKSILILLSTKFPHFLKLLQQKNTTPYRVEVPAMEKMIFMSLGQLVPSS